MILYQERLGHVTFKCERGWDLYLLPCSRFPLPLLVTGVAPHDVDAAPEQQSYKAAKSEAEMHEALGEGYRVHVHEAETWPEAIARARAAVSVDAEESPAG